LKAEYYRYNPKNGGFPYLMFEAGRGILDVMTTQRTPEWFFADGHRYEGQAPTGDVATATISLVETCYRCGGSGRYPSSRYNGECLKCHAQGRVKVTAKIFTGEALAAHQARKEKREAAKEAKRQAEQAAKAAELEAKKLAFSGQFPGLIDSMRSQTDPFLSSLLDQFDAHGSLTERQVEAAQRKLTELANPVTSNHLGTVGERQEFTLTVTYATWWEGKFGCTSLITFVDTDGNRLSWKASGIPQLERGDVVQGRATVKEHYEYQGKKQTALTRAKFTVISRQTLVES
jgi:hypothetical protein